MIMTSAEMAEKSKLLGEISFNTENGLPPANRRHADLLSALWNIGANICTRLDAIEKNTSKICDRN